MKLCSSLKLQSSDPEDTTIYFYEFPSLANSIVPLVKIPVFDYDYEKLDL